MESVIKPTGNWIKEKTLGSGAFGVITLWKNKASGETIAIKLYRDGVDGIKLKPKQREKWAKEVEVMKKLSHPNVVKAIPIPHDLMYLALKLPILCMEYCSGGDLRQILNKPENCSGLPEITVRKIMKNIKDAVEYLHSLNVIHRDIKPENIVLQNEQDYIYKLIDLGYEKEYDQNNSHFVGTMQYVAPEITHDYGPAADYWSFGLVCHEIITGFRPFLPHMTPFVWLPYVKKKHHEDICIYQNLDGSVDYSKQLSRKNYLSPFLNDEIEQWLRLALEFDPKKRGRGLNNHVIIFSLLDTILSKRIVTVFSTVSFEQLSYEVDNSTLISTLMKWIERDTKHNLNNQLLLLQTGEILCEENLAIKCWDPENSVAMVYVFKKENLKLPNKDPKIPQLTSTMLEEPKKPLPYHIIKRMWACSVYFIKHQIYLCDTLIEAYAAKLLSILNTLDELVSQSQQTENVIQQCYGKFNLQFSLIESNFIYKNDNKNYINPEPWQNNSITLNNNLLEIVSESKNLKEKINQARLEFDKAQSFCDHAIKHIDELKKLFEISCKLYEGLQHRPKELRNSESNSVEMVPLVVKCLEIRKNLTNNEEFIENLKLIEDCEIKAMHLYPDTIQCHKKIVDLNKNINLLHLSIFKDIWSSVDEIKKEAEKTIEAVGQKGNRNVIYISKNIFDNGSTGQRNISERQIREAPIKDSAEVLELLTENQNLRHLIDGIMSDNFRLYKEIMSQSEAMDKELSFHLYYDNS